MGEIDDIQENYRKHILEARAAELTKNAQLIEEFIEYCRGKQILLQKNNFDYVQTIGIVVNYPNLVYLLNNKILADKEELIDLAVLESEYGKRYAPGHFYSEKYIVMPNAYFRRGHYENSNFSPRFIEVFFKYKTDNKKYIAIDYDRVRINVDDSMYLEADTWFGAKFKHTISDIEDGIVKLRPPAGLEPFDITLFFGDTYSLDIKWSSKDGVKVFQAEEFKEDTNKIIKKGIEYFPVKYIHAEFDIKQGVFRHFDGAIHFYTKEEYYLRRDQDFNYNNKNDLQLKTLSQKLFKINGQIQTADWVELVSHYLTGNPLIFEYYEGKLPDKIIDTVEKLRNYRQKGNTTS